MDRAARVPRDKWREKSKREISRDEERNEVVPSDGLGRILAAVFYFVDREGGRGGVIYPGSKIVSTWRVNKLSIIPVARCP